MVVILKHHMTALIIFYLPTIRIYFRSYCQHYLIDCFACHRSKREWLFVTPFSKKSSTCGSSVCTPGGAIVAIFSPSLYNNTVVFDCSSGLILHRVIRQKVKEKVTFWVHLNIVGPLISSTFQLGLFLVNARILG